MKTRSDHRRSHCRQFEIIWAASIAIRTTRLHSSPPPLSRERTSRQSRLYLAKLWTCLAFTWPLAAVRGSEFIYSEPGYTALVDAVAPAGGLVVGVPLNAKLENDLDAIAR